MNAPGKKRLDQILLDDDLITEEQIAAALEHQKKYGGKFGSQLLFNGYIDETTLVKALSRQVRCEAVVLSNLSIPNEILLFIPKRLAVSRKIIPFDFDLEQNILKVACENPSDSNLRNELCFVAHGKKVKLFLAAELALNNAIARHYLHTDIPPGKFLISLPELEDEPDDRNAKRPREMPSILLVVDDPVTSEMLHSIFEKDRFNVFTTDSANDAISMLEGQVFQSVFIKDTVAGDYIDLIDRLRKKSPSTVVRYFESVSSLLLEDEYLNQQDSLLKQNLDLFTSLLATKDKLPFNHSGIVGSYTARLCHKLGLPAKEQALVISAAYLHDISRFYSETSNENNYRQHIDASVKLLKSVNLSPVVIEILKSMYKDLKHKYTKRLPIEALGGNILTVVDIFCENINISERLSLDKFESLKKKLRDLIGKLFLAEVVEVFIDMIQDEILDLNDPACGNQILLFADDQVEVKNIEIRLRNEGFRTFTLASLESLTQLYERSKPDMLILLPPKNLTDFQPYVAKLLKEGIQFDQTPAFLLTSAPDRQQFSKLLEMGIEDIIDHSANLDFFIMKLRKIQAYITDRNQNEEKLKSAAGKTQGRLGDMNLIDLLQALGPARRTVKLTVTPTDEKGQRLIMYLQEGRIVYALLDRLEGAEAFYMALTWTEGSWVIEAADPMLLPDENIMVSNESLMMEGCRLMDEHTRRIAIKMNS